jgi:hypothetical protein
MSENNLNENVKVLGACKNALCASFGGKFWHAHSKMRNDVKCGMPRKMSIRDVTELHMVYTPPNHALTHSQNERNETI